MIELVEPVLCAVVVKSYVGAVDPSSGLYMGHGVASMDNQCTYEGVQSPRNWKRKHFQFFYQGNSETECFMGKENIHGQMVLYSKENLTVHW